MAAPAVVDLHTHILPPDLPDLSALYDCGGFVHLERDPATPGRGRMMLDGRVFREVTDAVWDPARRIEACDRAGVDVQVLSTVPVMFNYWAEPEHGLDLARRLNDHLAGVVAAHPKRFAGLATLPLQAPDHAVRELERAVRDLGLDGAQIGTHVNGANLDDASLFPVFAAAQDLGAAIFVHPWDMLAPERMRRFWLPWLVGMPAELALAITSLLFAGVFERLPRLRIAFAHGGGAFPGTLGRIEHGFAARPDLCATATKTPPRALLKRLFVDSLVHDPDALRTLLRLFGPERVALGTDYPFPLGEAEPGTLIRSIDGLDAAARARLLGGTALEFLDRDAAEFAR